MVATLQVFWLEYWWGCSDWLKLLDDWQPSTLCTLLTVVTRSLMLCQTKPCWLLEQDLWYSTWQYLADCLNKIFGTLPDSSLCLASHIHTIVSDLDPFLSVSEKDEKLYFPRLNVSLLFVFVFYPVLSSWFSLSEDPTCTCRCRAKLTPPLTWKTWCPEKAVAMSFPPRPSSIVPPRRSPWRSLVFSVVSCLQHTESIPVELHTCVCLCVHVHVCVDMFVCFALRVCVCVCMCVCMCVHTCMCVCFVQYLCMCVCVHTAELC